MFIFMFLIVPNSPEDATFSVVSGSEVTVTWKVPDGKFDHFKLTLTGYGDPKIVTETGTSYTFVSLQYGTQYSLKLETQSGDVFSEAIMWTFTTSKYILSSN